MSVLALDFGTSSLKAAIYDRDVTCLRQTTIPYDYTVENGDWITIHTDLLDGALAAATKQFSDLLPDVEIISYVTFSPSLTLMDGEGRALYPVITHLDRRAKAESKRIQDEIGAYEFQKTTGLFPFTGGASITTVMWFQKNLPDLFEKTYKLGHLPTYIHKKLTGTFATDYVNASMMGAYETVTETGWAKDILGALGVPVEKFPDIHQAGRALGTLNEASAKWLGLKSGIPVLLGSNDAATAHVGAENSAAGEVLIITGSSEMVSVLSDKPERNEKYYLRKAIFPGMWQLYATTMGGFALEWMHAQMFRDLSKDEYYGTLIPSLLKEGRGTSTVRFLPYMAGDRQSLQKKTGSFTGLTLATTREEMLLSIFYGINEPIKKTIELGRKFLTIRDPIKITGGLTRTAGYSEFKRKLLKSGEIREMSDCTILGAAKLGAGVLSGSPLV
ncbi:sugar kinase [Oscillospiraceae bacterium OttesenSCG-928-G22]|nr:sugar kinase [Oscillospiraceae bacterium OttesenSCG-928-G22]